MLSHGDGSNYVVGQLYWRQQHMLEVKISLSQDYGELLLSRGAIDPIKWTQQLSEQSSVKD